MLQPVLVLLEVPEGTKHRVLGPDMETQLRMRGYTVQWAIPLSYTLEAPSGSVTSSDFPGGSHV